MNFFSVLIGSIFLFFAAFDPQVPFFPNGVGFTLLVSILLLPFALLKVFSQASSSFAKVYFYKAAPFFLVFFVAIVFILFRILINGGDNLGFILSWFKAFFVFLACLSVFLLFFSDNDPHYFIYSVFAVYIFNALINFAAGTFPAHFAFLEIFKGEAISDSLGKNPYRNSFISGSGYYSVGTAYGLVVLLLSFYLVKSRLKSAFFSISLAFIAIAAFIAARTSFFAIAPALLYVSKFRFFYFVVLLSLGGSLLYLAISFPELQVYRLWMLSFFDILNDSSASHLVNEMYFWPGDRVFLIGMGAVNDGTFSYTDGGYMQDILFGGVLFLAIKLSFVLVFFFTFFKSSPFFVSLVIFAVLTFHFKGLFVYNNAQGMAALYFIFFYLSSCFGNFKGRRLEVR